VYVARMNLDSATLEISGERATLSTEVAEAGKGSARWDEPGSVVRTGSELKLIFENPPHDPTSIRCRRLQVDVAPAAATLLEPTACNPSTSWSQPTEHLWAVACETRGLAPVWYGSAPGFEQVKSRGPCDAQQPLLRRIAN
jgi:hypothetical protein